MATKSKDNEGNNEGNVRRELHDTPGFRTGVSPSGKVILVGFLGSECKSAGFKNKLQDFAFKLGYFASEHGIVSFIHITPDQRDIIITAETPQDAQNIRGAFEKSNDYLCMKSNVGAPDTYFAEDDSELKFYEIKIRAEAQVRMC